MTKINETESFSPRSPSEPHTPHRLTMRSIIFPFSIVGSQKKVKMHTALVSTLHGSSGGAFSGRIVANVHFSFWIALPATRKTRRASSGRAVSLRKGVRPCQRHCSAESAFHKPQTWLRPVHRLARAVGRGQARLHASGHAFSRSKKGGSSSSAPPRAPHACRRSTRGSSTRSTRTSTAGTRKSPSPLSTRPATVSKPPSMASVTFNRRPLP